LEVDEELLKDIFNKQLTTKLCGGKLGMLKVVKNCNYNMKHIKIGGLRHTMQQWHGSMLVVAQ
jgi:hypothetical protein